MPALLCFALGSSAARSRHDAAPTTSASCAAATSHSAWRRTSCQLEEPLKGAVQPLAPWGTRLRHHAHPGHLPPNPLQHTSRWVAYHPPFWPIQISHRQCPLCEGALLASPACRVVCQAVTRCSPAGEEEVLPEEFSCQVIRLMGSPLYQGFRQQGLRETSGHASWPAESDRQRCWLAKAGASPLGSIP